MKRKFLLATLLAWLLVIMCAPAIGETVTQKYAILSIIGDKLDIVTVRAYTGSRMSRDHHDSLPIPGAVFDKAVLRAADSSLRKLVDSSPALLLASSPRIYDEQDKLFVGSLLALPEELDAAVRNTGANHLLLFTKHRGDARLSARDLRLGKQVFIGIGTLEGLGFYMDHAYRFWRTEPREEGRGFFASFAYITVSLVDVSTKHVIRQELITSSETRSTAESKDGQDPWAVMTEHEKIEMLRRMIAREVERTVPLLVRHSRNPT